MRIIIILLLAFLTAPSFAQIGEAPKDESILVGRAMNSPASPTLRYWNTSNGKYYSLMYDNKKYTITDLKSILFYATDEELEQLYQFLKAGFDGGDIKSVSVGEGSISVGKVGGQIMLFIYERGEAEGQTYLNKKGLDKLFGKRE